MGVIVEKILQVLAGCGLVWAVDKVAPSQVPAYEPVGIGFNLKTVVITISFAAGALLLWFLIKKLNLKIFKNRR